MSTILQIKRSSGTSAPAELAQGELAYTYGSGTQGNNGDRLFIGTGTETDGVAANIDIIGGKYFTSLTDHAIGTLTASSAILVDGNKAIDELFVGNNVATGGTIKFNEGTNNGAHFVGLKAPNAVSSSITLTLPSAYSNGQFLTVDGSGVLSFAAVPSGSFTISDGSTTDTFTTGQTLTFAGGTGIDTTVTDNNVSFAIDSTVTTNAGTQTLTNKTINSASNTITITESDISDLGSYITASSTDTLTNKTFDANGTGNSISNIEVTDLASGVLDTDLSSVSLSDDTLASAKAIKAYVDTQVTAVDVDIAADTGTGAITDSETLTFTGGEGIDTSVSGNTVTIAAEDASDTNKGVATFDATDFTVTSGDVTLNAERVEDIAGAMFSSNTETLITATYQDADGTIDLVVDNDLSNYDNSTSGFTTASSTDTLTNKSIDLTNNTLTGTTAEFNSALSDGSFATLAGTEALTNKTINTANNTITIVEADISDLGSYITASSTDTLSNKTIDSASNTITLDLSEGTLTGTTAEFNSALSDGSFATLAGTETLTSKTINGSNNTLSNIANSSLTNDSITIGSTTVALGASDTDLSGLTSLDVDNITINGNTISSTDTNGNIVLDPNGSGVVDVNTSRISGVSDPVNATDAANKQYVDAVAEGLHVHEQVHAYVSTALATITGNTVTYDNGSSGVGATLTLTTALDLAGGDLDGDTDITTGDRIIVAGESNAAHNGIYVVTSTTVLTRATDFDTPTEMAGGDFVWVTHGTTFADTGWVLGEAVTTVGTTAVSFVQFSGLGQITAGDGLAKSGNTLSVNVDDSSIEISSDALQVKALGITNDMLAGSIAASKLAGSIDNAKLSNSTITITGGDASSDPIALGETLAISDGEGIDTSISANTLTIAAELATTSNKGVASFSSDNFTVTSGAVTVTSIDGGTF